MSGKGFSLDRFLGIKQPAEGTAGTFQTIIAAIDHPCVAMMPGYGILAGAVGEQNIDRMQQLLEAAEEASGNHSPDERRVGKECGSHGSNRWAACAYKENNKRKH